MSDRLTWKDANEHAAWFITYGDEEATASDLIACLKSNPEARDAVLREFADDEQWSRALVEAKARAETAERALADLHKLIHEQSGLDDHRYSPAQMVTEMAQRWQGASDDCEKAERELADVLASRATIDAYMTQLVRERDEARAKLVAAEEAADRAEVVATQKLESLAHDHAKAVAERDEARATTSRYLQSWNNEANDIRETLNKVVAREKTALSRIAKLEAVVEAARQWNECVERGFMSAMRPDVARARLLAALRALDEQDSGGSGAAQDGVLQKPEPAGSSRCGGCRGSGIIPGTSAYDTEQCRECHGTGLFCPSQLIAAHPVGEQHAYLTRAEVAEMVAEACQTVAEQAVGGVGSFALRALAAELRKGACKTIGGGA